MEYQKLYIVAPIGYLAADNHGGFLDESVSESLFGRMAA
jgi:hypothetical protein